MALAAVSPVEPLRVDAEEPVHRKGERLPSALDDQVEVGSEQAPGVDAEPETVGRVPEELGERRSVGVVEEDEDAARATRRDVEVAVGEDEARAAGHLPATVGVGAQARQRS